MSLSGNDGRVNVTVDDGGPGVSDEQRAKIFEPFYSGAAACGKRAGYGLGLSIAKKAVEAQGGTVEVARSPQGGARFALHLPRVRRSEN
jgi:two-component system OmpR family sensor kinase